MIEDINHIGMIVDDYEGTVAVYLDVMGGTVADEVSVDGKVDIALVGVAGGQLELIARRERGTYLDGLLDALLEQSPYHVAYEVSDMAVAMASLADHGIEMYNDEPVEGIGAYVRAFPDPASVPGLPFELVERRGD